MIARRGAPRLLAAGRTAMPRMTVSRMAASLLVALLAAGCVSRGAETSAEPAPGEVVEPTAPVALGPATLRSGQSVRVGAADALRITFEAVESDSRCPRGVVCVWAGDAAVRLRLAHATGVATATLHTGAEPKAATHAGYVVRLVRLAPDPPSEGTPPSSYEATLEVSRP